MEILEENGMSVGDAIDLLFKLKDEVIADSNEIIEKRILEVSEEKSELEEKIQKLDLEMDAYQKLKKSAIDVHEKNMLLKEWFEERKTYDVQVQDAKRKISWANDFFRS